jgi:hypothetical protein
MDTECYRSGMTKLDKRDYDDVVHSRLAAIRIQFRQVSAGSVVLLGYLWLFGGRNALSAIFAVCIVAAWSFAGAYYLNAKRVESKRDTTAENALCAAITKVQTKSAPGYPEPVNINEYRARRQRRDSVS